ncbi:MAG: hypothetical protein ACRDRZ_13095, partial [Pseudonocardiaceae bacterium]
MEMVILFMLATFLTLRYGVTDVIATAKGIESPRQAARRTRGRPPRQRRTGRASASRFFGELWDDSWDDAAERRRHHHQRAKAGQLPRQRAYRATRQALTRQRQTATDKPDKAPPQPQRLRPVGPPGDADEPVAWGVVTADPDGALRVAEHADHDTAERAAEGNPWLALGGTRETYPLAYHHPQRGWLLAATGQPVPKRATPLDTPRPDDQQRRVVDDQGPNGHTRYRPMDRARAEDLAGQVAAPRDRTYPNPDTAPGGGIEQHTNGSGGTTMTAPVVNHEIRGVPSLRAYYVDTGNRLSAAQDTLSTSV